jgi:hypothetical protein
MGVNVVRRGHTGSPGSDGASPYPELSPYLRRGSPPRLPSFSSSSSKPTTEGALNSGSNPATEYLPAVRFGTSEDGFVNLAIRVLLHHRA